MAAFFSLLIDHPTNRKLVSHKFLVQLIHKQDTKYAKSGQDPNMVVSKIPEWCPENMKKKDNFGPVSAPLMPLRVCLDWYPKTVGKISVSKINHSGIFKTTHGPF